MIQWNFNEFHEKLACCRSKYWQDIIRISKNIFCSAQSVISDMLVMGFKILGNKIKKQKQCHFQHLATSECVRICLNLLVLKSDCFHTSPRLSWLAGHGQPCLVTMTEHCSHKASEVLRFDPQLQSYLNSDIKCAKSIIVCSAPVMYLSASFACPVIYFSI